MASLLTRTSCARCHIRFGCVTLALVVTLTHNPRWVVTYLLENRYDVVAKNRRVTSATVSAAGDVTLDATSAI